MASAVLCLPESQFTHSIEKDPKSTDVPSKPRPQDENSYTAGCVKTDQKQAASRKREASNILMECVKRRDNQRNIDSTLGPCDSSSVELSSKNAPGFLEDPSQRYSSKEDETESAELSDDSSLADSGIDCSKNYSPIHSVETSSISGLEEEMCQNLMDVDNIQSTAVESELNSLSPESLTTADLDDLSLNKATVNEIKSSPKPPLIQSLFKHMPPMIYFSTKDEEAVSSMPENILQTMKWKLSSITPPIVRETILKAGFSLLEATDTATDWLGSWGKHLKASSFKKMQRHQKVNHFPCTFHLGRKDRLWQNYKKMVSRYGDEIFDFFPESFILPTDLKALKDVWKDKCWILKPCASARGSGIKVIHKWCQVPKDQPYVVQHYISNPYLINGSKFDLRMYVLIASMEPLRVYLFEDGLVRFASQKYSMATKSYSNSFIHLTNFSINRKNSSYTSNNDENACQGHKWTLKSFWAYMSNSGIDTERIQNTIQDMIIKTILSAEGPMCRAAKTHASTAYNCYELFGFDIMLDKHLHPWLLEVNISPSLHTKSKLDKKVKGCVVKDTFNIAGFEVPAKTEITNPFNLRMVGNRHKLLKNRALSCEEKNKHAFYMYRNSEVKTDILDNLTADDLHCLMESEDELNRCGSFSRIFPTHTTNDYFIYFDHIRYYNVLLDAWEGAYHHRRVEGQRMLQYTWDKMFPPKVHNKTSLGLATDTS